MKKGKYIVVLLLGISRIFSQENIHYSQFYNAPMLTNPALCGQIGDDFFRLNGHMREQWSGLGGQQGFLYTTQSGGIDLSLANKHIGAGLYFLTDKSGGGIFNKIEVMPTASYSYIFGDNALTLGGQFVYSMHQFDRSSLRFGVNENDFNQSASYTDANVGLNFKRDFYYVILNVGVSAAHLLTPPLKFSKSAVTNTKLPMYFKAYTTVDWELTDRLKLSPGAYAGFQANSTDVMAGTNLSYKFMEMGTNGSRLILGLWGRTNNGNLESIIPKFGTQMNKLIIMASYDFNVSMTKSGGSQYFQGLTNTFEISIIFTGKPKVVPPLFEDDFILNPRY